MDDFILEVISISKGDQKENNYKAADKKSVEASRPFYLRNFRDSFVDF